MEKQSRFAQFFFDRADALMVAVDSEEAIVDVNGKASEILGYSKEELKGQNWFDMFVPVEQREEARRAFRLMLTGTLRHIHSEYAVATRSGQQLTLNFHNILVSGENGETVGVFSSAEDVTTRVAMDKGAKVVEDRLQVSLDYMIEGCQIVNPDWRYVYVNEAAARQGRKRKEELLGYTMMQVYPGIDRTEMFSNLRNCMTNRVPHRMENEFVFPDGSTACFELYMEPVPEGVLILSMDITRNKVIEAELNAYRGRLEQVVAQRTAECAEANEELTRKIQEAQKTDEALKLRAMILDNAQEAIFLVNTRGDFVYVNGAATDAYGYSLDEFLNMNLRHLMPAKDESAVDGYIKLIMDKKVASLETVHKSKNGAEMPVKVHASLVRTVHGQFIVFVARRLFRR